MIAPVAFLDTGVLLEILDVPGKASDHARYKAEFDARIAQGQRFVIPVASIIETGNHISQIKLGDSHQAAVNFANFLRASLREDTPLTMHEVAWDTGLVNEVLNGDSTGEDFIELAGSGRFGAGDLSILVQRERFVANSVYSVDQVEIWTTEELLGAYA